MLIVCKTCASAYEIPASAVADGPCRLRCAGCGDVWAIEAVAEGEIAAADRPIARELGQRKAAFPPQASDRGRFRPVAAALAVLAISSGAMGAVGARAAIVAAVPATARAFAFVGLPVNARGLEFADVRSTLMEADAKKVMLVEGAIVNLRDGDAAQPDLRVALRAADGRELYAWTVRAGKPKLGPRERIAFRTRLAAPPSGVKDVLVKFAEPGDKLALNEGGP